MSCAGGYDRLPEAGTMRAVNRGKRQQWLLLLISAIALVGQMLLPIAHAQNMAQRGGNPLLYAFCGKVSPAMAEQLLAVAPPELLQALENSQHDQQQPVSSCELCALVHAGHAGPAWQPVLLLDGTSSQQAGAQQPFAPTVQLVQLPLLRGPPIVS